MQIYVVYNIYIIYIYIIYIYIHMNCVNISKNQWRYIYESLNHSSCLLTEEKNNSKCFARLFFFVYFCNFPYNPVQNSSEFPVLV